MLHFDSIVLKIYNLSNNPSYLNELFIVFHHFLITVKISTHILLKHLILAHTDSVTNLLDAMATNPKKIWRCSAGIYMTVALGMKPPKSSKY